MDHHPDQGHRLSCRARVEPRRLPLCGNLHLSRFHSSPSSSGPLAAASIAMFVPVLPGAFSTVLLGFGFLRTVTLAA